MENENYTGVKPSMDASEDESVKLTAVRANDDQDKMEEEDAASKMPLTDDGTKVKFSKSSSAHHGLDDDNAAFNGEAKVAIESVERVPFAGMGKEELLRYVNDPFWVKMRWLFFILFWLLWLAMLAGAIGIVVLAPKCAPPPKRDWWQRAGHYQVVVASFQDSDGNGVGDLQGLKSQLPYLVDIGVSSVWLAPIYKSPRKDFGYDISDFTAVDPLFGTMTDFEELVKAAEDSGLKIVLDFVPNHTSDKHEWFLLSRNRTDPYTNYYVWAQGKGPDNRDPPNNWVSRAGGPAWTYDSVRNEFYYHSYGAEEPDLNLRNQLVKSDIEEIMKFWLDKGVDGFNIHAAGHLFEDALLTDDPPSGQNNTTSDDYEHLIHVHTSDQEDVVPLFGEWRNVLDEYEAKDSHHRILIVGETGSSNWTWQLFANETAPRVDMALNYLPGFPADGYELYNVTKEYLAAVPDHAWPNWLIGTSKFRMAGSGVDPTLLDSLQMVATLIGGSSVTYYGQEIGLGEESVANLHNAQTGSMGNHTRYHQLTPMQWTNGTNGGFSNSTTTWLPVGTNSGVNTVESQSGNPHSHLGVFKRLSKLRTESAIVYGDTDFPYRDNGTFSFTRAKKGTPGYLVVINIHGTKSTVDFKNLECCRTFTFPDNGQLVIRSSSTDPSSKAARVELNAVTVGPFEAVVVTFIPQFKSG